MTKTKFIKAIILTLAAIIFAAVIFSVATVSAGAAVTPEASWGSSKSSLTESGTLREAMNALGKSNSSVKYIRLEKDVEFDSPVYISGSGVTFDLNGKRLTSTYIYSSLVEVCGNGTSVTFTDSGTGGEINAGIYAAIAVKDDSVLTIEGGKFCASTVLNASPRTTVTLKGGTLVSAFNYAIENYGALIIEGGRIEGGSVAAIRTYANTTVKGGSLEAGSHGMIEYCNYLLDLSEHANPEGISVYNAKIENVVLGDSTVKLPTGYCFLNSKGFPTTYIEPESAYSIQKTPNELPPEAKWGASESDLGGAGREGTLAEALLAVNGTTVKYIKIFNDIANVTLGEYNNGINVFADVTLTLDLNGCNVILKEEFVYIENASLCVTDSSTEKNGVLTSPTHVILLQDGRLTIRDGSINLGKSAPISMNSPGAELSMIGGSLSSGHLSAVVMSEGRFIYTGGTISALKENPIQYEGGALDLSGHKNPDGIKFHNYTNEPFTSVLIPAGYGIYCEEERVGILQYDCAHEIKKLPENLTTHTLTVISAENGSVTHSAASDSVKETEPIILTVTPNDGYVLHALAVTDAEGKPVELENNIFIMPACDVTVTAEFRKETLYGASPEETLTAGSLNEAFSAVANGEASYIKLMTNITSSDEIYVYNGDITVDLNGYTWTIDNSLHISSRRVTEEIVSSGKLTVTDTSSSKTGTIKSSSNLHVSESATFILNSGTIDGGAERAVLVGNSGSLSNSTFIMNGGTLKGEYGVSAFGKSVIIRGGSFEVVSASIVYYGGGLDISDYPRAYELTLISDIGQTVTLPHPYITLPDCTAFYIDGAPALNLISSYGAVYTFGTAHSGGEASCISPAACAVCGTPYGDIDANNHTALDNGKCTGCSHQFLAKVSSTGEHYDSISEALLCAENGDTVTVFVSSDENITIPAGVTLIANATLSGEVSNNGIIESGSFSGAFTNSGGDIKGGEFHNAVVSFGGKIYGGEFFGAVSGYIGTVEPCEIYGGIFLGGLLLDIDSTLYGGTVHGTLTVYSTVMNVKDGYTLSLGENFRLEANEHSVIVCEEHLGGIATCTLGYNCAICGAAVSETGHNYDTGAVTTAPTCTHKGIKTYTCQNDSAHTYTEELDALGHTPEAVSAKAPTCTETGKSEGVRCSVCGVTLTEGSEISATGHSYDNACDVDCNVCADTREPSEHADADKNKICDVCGKELKKGLSGGAVAGIIAGSAAILGVGGFSVFWFVIKKKRLSDLFSG